MPFAHAKGTLKQEPTDQIKTISAPGISQTGTTLVFIHAQAETQKSGLSNSVTICGETASNTGADYESAAPNQNHYLRMSGGELPDFNKQIYKKGTTTDGEYTAVTPTSTNIIPTQDFVTENLDGLKAIEKELSGIATTGKKLMQAAIKTDEHTQQAIRKLILKHTTEQATSAEANKIKDTVNLLYGDDQEAFTDIVWNQVEAVTIPKEVIANRKNTDVKSTEKISELSASVTSFLIQTESSANSGKAKDSTPQEVSKKTGNSEKTEIDKKQE
uniref:Variant surface glycoprotein 1125.2973 n=1 Tax=Trypanosoma brucei TaxID=5691 RepID=A0A1J0R979_9TRYP|nr:variant surface glycoprotein 1125.2973 [Trypanosoma brucei]